MAVTWDFSDNPSATAVTGKLKGDFVVSGENKFEDITGTLNFSTSDSQDSLIGTAFGALSSLVGADPARTGMSIDITRKYSYYGEEE